MNKERINTTNKKQGLSVCTEAYKEHIMYTFNGFCKTVIRFAALNAWRDRSRRRQKEISLEYLTEEKFYPLGTTDEYFEAPYEEYPITICGQTVILTNGELAAALARAQGRERMSAQAVGGAVGHNPISLIIPCHRVVGRDGSLTGYAGGIAKKAALLALEGVEMGGLFLPKRGTAL